MLLKDCIEWTVQCPWGQLALVSWGDPKNPPILLVHGYMDSAATFAPMLDRMPDKYFYVALDFPGHGKSDHLPASVAPLQSHLVESIRIAVNHLNWDRFIYLSHSMAILIGLYYNAVLPGQIISFIALDPGQPLGAQKIAAEQLQLSFAWSGEYYDNYHKFNSLPRTVKYDDVINSVAKKRGFTVEQASLMMSRSLKPAGDDSFILTIDNKMKKLSHDQIPIESIVHLMIAKQPVMLILVAKENVTDWSILGLKIIKEVENKNKNCKVVYLDGGHDFHIVNSSEVASCVVQFLENSFSSAFIRCRI